MPAGRVSQHRATLWLMGCAAAQGSGVALWRWSPAGLLPLLAACSLLAALPLLGLAISYWRSCVVIALLPALGVFLGIRRVGVLQRSARGLYLATALGCLPVPVTHVSLVCSSLLCWRGKEECADWHIMLLTPSRTAFAAWLRRHLLLHCSAL